MLFVQDNPDQSCAEADSIARRRLAEVDQRLAILTALKSELTRMIEDCACGRISQCRVIETLANETHEHGRLA